MAAITGPIALYNNLPIEPQYYAPWRFVISNIVLGPTTLVTLVIPDITNLNYVIGQLVRFIIPPTFGCRELNGKEGYVFSIIFPNQVAVTVDSTNMNPYIASSATTKAQLLAVGDINYGSLNTSRQNNAIAIPGSFINISPN